MVKQTSKSKQRSQSGSVKQGTGNDRPGQSGPNGQGAQVQGRQSTRRTAQRAVKQQKQQELQFARRSGRITFFSFLGTGIVILAAIVGVVLYNHNQPQTETIVNASYPPVDGIYCDALEQTVYHIHAHISIYINGTLNPLPQNTGIASDGS